MAAPAPNGFQCAVETVGPAGWVILALLGLVSVVAWSLLVTRWTVLRKARRGNADYLEAYRQTRRPLELHTRGLDLTGTPLFSVYTAGSRELCLQIFGTSEKDGSFPVRLQNAGRIAPTQLQPVVAAMDRAVREMALRLEEGVPLLAACVVTAPALGLLGAVWGIMDAFARLAPAQGNPTLQEVAPGIAGALAIAALGLVAGIPALFGHHYLARVPRDGAPVGPTRGRTRCRHRAPPRHARTACGSIVRHGRACAAAARGGATVGPGTTWGGRVARRYPGGCRPPDAPADPPVSRPTATPPGGRAAGHPRPPGRPRFPDSTAALATFFFLILIFAFLRGFPNP